MNFFHYSRISLSIPQKKYQARVPTILMPSTFHIALLNCYTPNCQGYPKSRPGVIGLASSTLQSQPIRKSCPWFSVFFVFSDKISFLAKRSTFAHSMSYIFWMLLFQRLILAIKTLFERPMGHHIFAYTVGCICKLNLTLRRIHFAFWDLLLKGLWNL